LTDYTLVLGQLKAMCKYKLVKKKPARSGLLITTLLTNLSLPDQTLGLPA